MSLQPLKSFITLFFSQSSIHGIYHLSRRYHPLETLVWVALISAAAYGAGVLSTLTLKRYQENPTVISMERDRFSWNTTFPAATICPTYKLSEARLERYLESSQEANKTLLRLFLTSLAEATYDNFDKVVEYSRIPPEKFLSVLTQVRFEFTPAVTNSGVNSKLYGLDLLVTEMGICYVFNSKLGVYSTPQYWGENRWDLVEGKPIFYIHPLDGEVFANVVNMSTGFDMYLHGPYEVADIASKKISSEDGMFLQMFITGLTIFSSENVKNLNINQRKCRFYHESNLKHFPVYSYVLCQMECRANLAKKLCGCVPHFYRPIQAEKVCNVAGLHCLATYKDRLVYLENECSCLPNCDEVNYVVEDMDTRIWFLGSSLQWGLKEYPKMRLRRDVIFGFTDVLGTRIHEKKI